ncbi:hypothetical protein [Nocardia sp. CA-119907]|uniref:hypothetical protein n=1 Tax=Nocardia sp. CA-119907 TaxID=3239973 RepID=UPI003D95D6D0
MNNHEFNPPSAERERSPPDTYFDLEPMQDDEIIFLQRAITMNMHMGWRPGERFDSFEIGDDLSYHVYRAMRGLAANDPERARNIIHRCATSDIDDDWRFAAETVGYLVNYNYEFVKETLLRFISDSEKYQHELAVQIARENTIPRLMHESLTPEQIEDFNRSLEDAGDDAVSPFEIAQWANSDYHQWG